MFGIVLFFMYVFIYSYIYISIYAFIHYGVLHINICNLTCLQVYFAQHFFGETAEKDAT